MEWNWGNFVANPGGRLGQMFSAEKQFAPAQVGRPPEPGLVQAKPLQIDDPAVRQQILAGANQQRNATIPPAQRLPTMAGVSPVQGRYDMDKLREAVGGPQGPLGSPDYGMTADQTAPRPMTPNMRPIDYLDQMPRNTAGLIRPGYDAVAMQAYLGNQKQRGDESQELIRGQNQMQVAGTKDPNSLERFIEGGLIAGKDVNSLLKGRQLAMDLHHAGKAGTPTTQPEEALKAWQSQQEGSPAAGEHAAVLREIMGGEQAKVDDKGNVIGGRFSPGVVGRTLAANPRILDNPEAMMTLAQKMMALGVGDPDRVQDQLATEMIRHANEAYREAGSPTHKPMQVGGTTITPRSRAVRALGMPAGQQTGYQLSSDDLPTDATGNLIAPTFWNDNAFAPSPYKDVFPTFTQKSKQDRLSQAKALDKMLGAMRKARDKK